jgi:hypothetical protein
VILVLVMLTFQYKRCEIMLAVHVMITIFWDSLVGKYQHFKYLLLQDGARWFLWKSNSYLTNYMTLSE